MHFDTIRKTILPKYFISRMLENIVISLPFLLIRFSYYVEW